MFEAQQERAVPEGARKTTILTVTESAATAALLQPLITQLECTPLSAPPAELSALLELLDPPPGLIVYDAAAPGFSAAAICQRLQSNLRTRFVPILFIQALASPEAERAAFDAGAQDYLRAPLDATVLFARLRLHQQLHAQKRQLAALIQTRNREIDDAHRALVERLSAAAAHKDDETGSHIARMALMAQGLARAAGLSEAEAELLRLTAPVHDLGKIGIPDRILLKPTPLTPEEWRVMRTHPGIGAAIIGQHAAPILQMARCIALTHHEKWDGSGYPNGLRGAEIPLAGRIVALADVFDSLTSERPFKPAWAIDAATTFIRDQAGRHFDPHLAGLFLELLPEWLRIRAAHPEQAAALFDARTRVSETLA